MSIRKDCMTGRMRRGVLAVVALGAASLALGGEGRPSYQSPYAVVMAADGSRLYVSHHTAGVVLVVDPAARKMLNTIPVGKAPTGLALSRDGATLYVADDDGSVAVVDTKAGKVAGTVAAGRSAYGLALSKDGSRLFVCDRFLNRVVAVDAAKRQPVQAVAATREPLFAALDPEGKTLCVSSLLPLGPSTDPEDSAAVDLYDAANLKSLGAVRLPSGCTDVHQVACSPDGKWAYFVHVVARFNIPPTQLERGWINNSGLTFFDLPNRKVFATVLLDEVGRGSANPFGAALTPDGKTLAVSFMGTHEVAFVDLAKVHEVLGKMKAEDLPGLINELSWLRRCEAIRRAPSGGQGPHGIALDPQGKTAYVANYYSDSLGVVDIERGRLDGTIALGPKVEPDIVRQGEMHFFDAMLCFQQWQSCGTCHPDARVDGLNWDLLNDGIGNPKNARTMLDAHRRGAMMASGIRQSMEVAVRAGYKFIQFHEIAEDKAKAVDEYIRSLKARPSPYRDPDGSLTPAAQRGEKIFTSPKVGCSACHSGPLYTDLKMHDVGTGTPIDGRNDFTNPSLIEIYRTGPYLHDGRAVTLQEVFTKFNKDDRHGHTSQLSKEELDDLVAFLLSL
jgi:YVTN family beta-propeller protein